MPDQVIEKRLGVAHARLERLAAFGADQRIRIVSVRQEQEANLPALENLAERVLQRTPRRRASGAIAIEAEDHFLADLEDALEVLRRRRSSQRRDRVVDAGLMQADDVHVAFNDEQAGEGSRSLARLIQPVELLALVKELGLGRVHVLRLAL